MRKRHILLAVGLFLLVSCASETSGFSVASGPLKPDEIQMLAYAPSLLSANAFDVVNQDQNSGSSTGIAGRVQPSPADILSTYAASKFRAQGGAYNVRFIIKQASVQVKSTTAPPKDDSFWSFDFFGGNESKAEMTVNITINLVASLPDGTGATISATTAQTEPTVVGSSDDNRKVYMKVMGRAVTALDAEITRQLPIYFPNVMGR